MNLKKRNYITDFPPIVAVNDNSANPHYEPTELIHKEIKENDFVLIDLWAKLNKPDGVWSEHYLGWLRWDFCSG